VGRRADGVHGLRKGFWEQMAETKMVLALMAHPDDIEILCAGTIVRLQREAGCRVALATMTSGDCGSMDHAQDEIARIRYNEAKRAADLIGADYYNAGSQDMFVMYDTPTLRRVLEILRQVNPDIVVTHSPVDYHVDHEMTSRLVRTACFGKGIPNMMSQALEPAKASPGVPHLFYADPVEGKDWFGDSIAPHFTVDITSAMETKEQMLCCHESQRDWLRAHHNMDQYVISMKEWSSVRGETIGVQYGEGFRQHLGHSYPQNNIIKELLE
jgi:LmbE family N-acetylglucosaminyl deacetylase